MSIKHRFLQRQLKRMGLSFEKPPKDIKEWQALIKSIESVYEHHDDDRYLLERSLEISSKEMKERFEKEKEMNLQLAQAGKLVSLGTLASGVAHELNNPLAIIKGFVELIQDHEDLPPDVLKKVSKIEALSDRMEGTIKHLLKLSRQGQVENNSAHDIHGAIQDTLELMKKQLEYDHINVSIESTVKNSRVYGSASQINSIFQNLFVNSRDAFFSVNDGRAYKIDIHISEQKDRNSIVVRFSDNASGIPQEILERICDPFFTTKAVGSGTGLGLSISRQIIEELGGHLNVTSEEGQGSTFLIELPKAQDNVVEMISGAGSIVSNDKISLHQTPTTQLNALVVDDEEDICALLKSQMAEYYNVEAVTSPMQALQILQKEKFDVLITDLRMPSISGDELAQEARKISPDLQVVIISGHLHGREMDGLKNIEPFLFIEKPFKSLADAIQSINEFIYSKQVSNAA